MSRLIMTMRDEAGRITMRRKSESKRVLKRRHECGTCHAFCSYCVTEVENFYLKDSKGGETK